MIIGYGTASRSKPSDKATSGCSSRDDRVLSHMTVWRMLTWLGSQLVGWRTGLRWLAQADPGCTCHRFVGAVDPCKFRNLPREQKLRHARRMLHLIDEWERRFPEPFFPRYATRSGFD